MYCVTTKIEMVEGELVFTPIAFPHNEENIAVFQTWPDWKDFTNKNYYSLHYNVISVSGYYKENPICREGCLDISSIEGLDVTLIENL